MKVLNWPSNRFRMTKTVHSCFSVSFTVLFYLVLETKLKKDLVLSKFTTCAIRSQPCRLELVKKTQETATKTEPRDSLWHQDVNSKPRKVTEVQGQGHASANTHASVFLNVYSE